MSRFKTHYILQPSTDPRFKMEIMGSNSNNKSLSPVNVWASDDPEDIQAAKARLLELGITSKADYGNNCTITIKAPYTNCSLAIVNINM